MSLIEDNWEKLFDKYNIREQVRKNGLFYITANQIREFKEPRLMTKFDTEDSIPSIFDKLSILPVTRGKYVIGEFDLYMSLPENRMNVKSIKGFKIPEYYETIDINEIRSEANAINVIALAKILDDFLEEDGMVQTVSGRMSSGEFAFQVGRYIKGTEHTIQVVNSQVEIDGGFENANVFSIVEGKNVVHNDFLIRQLYYPYRLWANKISKPIRPVFMIYSNNIFRFLEYEFTDLMNYNSIRLVKERNYSLEDVDITFEDLVSIYRITVVKPEPKVTFIQADSFDKVISLVENLNESPMSKLEIAELFGFKERQSDYYFNACKYLGLVEKRRDEEGARVYLKQSAKKLLTMRYKERQLAYVKLILEHQIFYELFDICIKTKAVPDKNIIINKMVELNVCESSLIERRQSSIRGWLSWILNLVSI